MARPLRLEFPGAIYHLTSRGNARHKVFFTDADRELFLKTLTGVVRRYDWVCHAYCLMANRFHLLVETPKANFRLACASSTAFTLKVLTAGTTGLDICFRGGSRRSWLKGNLTWWSFAATSCSILARIKGNAKASTWRWSSYRATAGLAPVAEFLRTDWILEQFGKSRYERSSSTGSSLGTEWRLGRGTISRVRSIWGVKRSSKNTLLVKKTLKRYHERN